MADHLRNDGGSVNNLDQGPTSRFYTTNLDAALNTIIPMLSVVAISPFDAHSRF